MHFPEGATGPSPKCRPRAPGRLGAALRTSSRFRRKRRLALAFPAAMRSSRSRRAPQGPCALGSGGPAAMRTPLRRQPRRRGSHAPTGSASGGRPTEVRGQRPPPRRALRAESARPWLPLRRGRSRACATRPVCLLTWGSRCLPDAGSSRPRGRNERWVLRAPSVRVTRCGRRYPRHRPDRAARGSRVPTRRVRTLRLRTHRVCSRALGGTGTLRSRSRWECADRKAGRRGCASGARAAATWVRGSASAAARLCTRLRVRESASETKIGGARVYERVKF